jgi:hypothetical protein
MLMPNGRLELRMAARSDRDGRWRRLDGWYRQELRNAIPGLISKWAPVLNVDVPSWGIRRMKTKWGTCKPGRGHIWLWFTGGATMIVARSRGGLSVSEHPPQLACGRITTPGTRGTRLHTPEPAVSCTKPLCTCAYPGTSSDSLTSAFIRSGPGIQTPARYTRTATTSVRVPRRKGQGAHDGQPGGGGMRYTGARADKTNLSTMPSGRGTEGGVYAAWGGKFVVAVYVPPTGSHFPYWGGSVGGRPLVWTPGGKTTGPGAGAGSALGQCTSTWATVMLPQRNSRNAYQCWVPCPTF